MLSLYVVPNRCPYSGAPAVVGWEASCAARPWPISVLSLAHGDGEGPR